MATAVPRQRVVVTRFGCPAARGGDQVRRPSSPRGADTAGLHAMWPAGTPTRAKGHREWLAEVVYLVMLVGYCIRDYHRVLVYDFMARRCLEDDIFKNLLSSVPWATRLKLALGAAKVLTSLHKAEMSVSYWDFKASNIMLEPVSTCSLQKAEMPVSYR